MKCVVLCVILAMSCSALATPEENHALVVRSRRDLMEHSVKLVSDLVSNLQKAAQEALQAVGNFTAGVMHEGELIRDKIVKDIEAFRNRVSQAIENVFQKFSNVSTVVRTCVDQHRDHASQVFDETLSLTMVCVDERIAEVGKLIEELKTLANDAIAEAATAMDTMKKCTQDNTNFINTASCLGVTAAQIEFKSIGFLTHSTVLIGRINLSIATLPAALEVCAGTRLIQTGLQSGKIIIDIGSCSASAIFNNVAGTA